jgi:hypothetical protein
MPADESKTCTRCGESKPLTEFYKWKRSKDGLTAGCKECIRAARREYVAEHHEEVNASLRAWHQGNREKAVARLRDYWAENAERLREQKREHYAANRERILEDTRKYAERNPQKMDARMKMRSAIKTGKLVREPCLFCDDPTAEGHHHDYSKPLEVTWLCKRHHELIHRVVSQPVDDAA